MKKPIPWREESDPILRRRVGKTNEEVNELGAVLSRILIQGLNAIDPTSGIDNKSRLENEIADVHAQLYLLIDTAGLDIKYIADRKTRKIKLMRIYAEATNDEET